MRAPLRTYRGEGAAARAGCGLPVAWGRQDTAGSNNDDIPTAKLLLQLANQSLLNLVESL